MKSVENMCKIIGNSMKQMIQRANENEVVTIELVRSGRNGLECGECWKSGGTKHGTKFCSHDSVLISSIHILHLINGIIYYIYSSNKVKFIILFCFPFFVNSLNLREKNYFFENPRKIRSPFIVNCWGCCAVIGGAAGGDHWPQGAWAVC